jgi:ribonuclease HI
VRVTLYAACACIRKHMLFVVFSEDGKLISEGAQSGGSINIAGLVGVEEALRSAEDSGYTEALVRTDSTVVISWVTKGIHSSVNPSLAFETKANIEAFRKHTGLTMEWVPRSANPAALYIDGEWGTGCGQPALWKAPSDKRANLDHMFDQDPIKVGNGIDDLPPW